MNEVDRHGNGEQLQNLGGIDVRAGSGRNGRLCGIQHDHSHPFWPRLTVLDHGRETLKSSIWQS